MKHTELLSMTQFARIPVWRQLEILNQNGSLIDIYFDQCRKVKVYHYNKYFVEETSIGGRILDIIPFKRGFKLPLLPKISTGNNLKLNDKDLALCK